MAGPLYNIEKKEPADRFRVWMNYQEGRFYTSHIFDPR